MTTNLIEIALAALLSGAGGTLLGSWLSRDKTRADTSHVMQQTIGEQAMELRQLRAEIDVLRAKIDAMEERICKYAADCSYRDSREEP